MEGHKGEQLRKVLRTRKRRLVFNQFVNVYFMCFYSVTVSQNALKDKAQ